VTPWCDRGYQSTSRIPSESHSGTTSRKPACEAVLADGGATSGLGVHLRVVAIVW
jgi:hypothetical protein